MPFSGALYKVTDNDSDYLKKCAVQLNALNVLRDIYSNLGIY
jgi:hypothetical protein